MPLSDVVVVVVVVVMVDGCCVMGVIESRCDGVKYERIVGFFVSDCLIRFFSGGFSSSLSLVYSSSSLNNCFDVIWDWD